MSLSCVVMMSTMRPNRVFRANSSPILGFPLHFVKRISRREEICDQIVAAIGRKGEVARSCSRRRNARRTNSRPVRMCLVQGVTKFPKVNVHASLEAIQSPLFHQIEAQLAETESGPVVAKVLSKYRSQPHVGET